VAFEFDDEDFVDLATRARPAAEVILSCVALGRQASKRVQINLVPSLLEEIRATRVRVGFAASRQLFRIQADDCGPIEPIVTKRGLRRLIRAGLPTAGFAWFDGRIEPDYDVDLVGRAILIAVPEEVRARARPVPALPPPGKARADAGDRADAAPVRDEATQEAIDRRLQELLGASDLPPAEFGGVRFTPSERAILAVLLKNPRVSRAGILAATHDPAAGDDDRDEKLVDVFVSKMRTRLGALGCSIDHTGGGVFRLSLDDKTTLRRLIGRAA
jgi:hypothetical protein